MFNQKYLDWDQKRIKGILELYGHKFIAHKKILDLGCGHANISGVFYRMGADVIAVDARQEHLKIAQKKFPGIKVMKADLDNYWYFAGKTFDIIFDLDLICHLNNFEKHLRNVCLSATNLVLETAVCDSDDPNKCIKIKENSFIYDSSLHGISSRPSAAYIEKILTECNMSFTRQDFNKYNSGSYVYDWQSKNDDSCNINHRRLWFAVKKNIPAQEIPYQNHKNRKLIKPPILNSSNINTRNKEIRKPLINNLSKKIDIKNSVGVENKFVIIIPSYNNSKWCEKNIQSALNQNYNNFRIIFVDDNSTDDTFNKVSNIVSSNNKCSIIKNDSRVGALENLYNMIHSCEDDEIILTLDGDDWLSNNNVLNTLNNVYSSENIWMTYGQYKNSHDNSLGIAQQYSKKHIEKNSFRENGWYATHLRTFYSWLFKRIKKTDLLYKDKFLPMTWDVAIMYPMLEMSGYHSKCISDILYVYNTENPLNDHKTNLSLQRELDHFIRIKQRYEPLSFITFKELGKFGRIGNQLFQVANLISLAKDNNAIMNIDWFCNYTNKDMTTFFKHPIKRVNVPSTSYTYNEPYFHYKKIPYTKEMNLHGYFQSEKYFEDNKDLIRYYFEPADFVVNKLMAKYGNFLFTNTCSLHIRRGDYVNNNIHDICNFDYYQRAIDKISSIKKIDNFIVFSDDINWCKQTFPSNYIFIEGNNDIEDLFLMSKCENNIISNSSFSWWGSYLNKNKNKIIIAPDKWLNDSTKNDIDIYTKEMIKI